MAKDTPLQDVAGGGGDALLVRPTSQACAYQLVYRPISGLEHVVSLSPAYYLMAAAKASQASGDKAVCASAIRHSPNPADPGQAPHDLKRRIDAVPIECALFSNGKWGATRTVVDGGEKWAAWVGGLEENPGGGYKLTYTHDFSFQFLNLSDEGRPSEDGVYQAVLTVGPGPSLTAAKTSKLSNKTVNVSVGP